MDFGRVGRAVAGRFSDEAVANLENNPNVRYVERNGLMWALEQETPYGIEKVEADVAIDEGETGDGVSVAIIDTGIDAQHETLEENLGDGYATEDAACTTDCGGGPFGGGNDIDECLEEWDDDNDHGTHCAGTAGAADNDAGVLGVAPDVTLHAVKVLQCDGGGTYDDIAAGIQWSADQGHDVQNMSLGGDESEVVADAVAYADQQGVVMVAAAGNDGPCTDCVGYPAAYDEVIAVSATDENDDLADFSSTGPEVELAAPGVDVLSSIPRDDYDEFSGTSMSSPHVAGAAATLIAAGTNPDDVRAELKDAADDVGLDDNEQGAGRLNVADALDLESNGDDDDDDDDDDDESDPESDPDIDEFTVSTRTSGRWNRADVDWAVSDGDGALESVTSELLAADGVVLDSESSSVGGSSASGEHELRSDDEPEEVRLTVVDESGNETSDTRAY
ncbi:serine protease [Natronococcus pandeyae]|uniref:Serine protease n=1 Tax=Natronococcus pandeyae TaxID=2055836 RepID=A0A8J8Q4D0_9EURY|nr:serine protease [Natronococcus pandeyae]